jgi:hypothetical protein
VVLVVARSAVEHLEQAIVMDHAGIANDEVFPRMFRVGDEDRIGGASL